MKYGIGIAAIIVLLLIGGAWWSRSLAERDPALVSRTGLHWHPSLEIFIKGEQMEIPEGIGLAGVHSPMHTHEDLPLVHLEFEGPVRGEDIALGTFFRVWGQDFSRESLLGHKNGSEGQVRMLVNGVENAEFERYQMHDGDQIELHYE